MIADHVDRAAADPVEHCRGVIGHVPDGVAFDRTLIRLSHVAVVNRDAAVAGGDARRHLQHPASVVRRQARNEQERRTVPAHLIEHIETAGRDSWPGATSFPLGVRELEWAQLIQ